MPNIHSKQYTVNSKKEASKSSLRDAIITDIHAKKIHPRPRWQYILLHTVLWGSVIVTLFLGSLAFSFVLMEYSLPERVYARWMDMPNRGFVAALPYLWWIGMIFALTAGYFIFSRTDRGYRLHAAFIATILILWSMIWGTILYVTRAPHWGESQMRHFQPRYREFRQWVAHMVPRPEDGILALRVSNIDNTVISGHAPGGQLWSVSLLCQDDICEYERDWLRSGKPTLFEGKIISQWAFEASRVVPSPWFWAKNLRFIPKDIRGNTSPKKAE